MSSKFHISRGWESDPFIDSCGCEKAACGFAVETNNDCQQHSFMAGKTIRNSHPAEECPAHLADTPTAPIATVPAASVLEMTIVVKDTKDFTATQLAKATALAVADFTPAKSSMSPSSSWSLWMDGFRKLLKRMKPGSFASLPSKLEEAGVSYSQVEYVGVELIVVEPLPKEQAQALLKNAQVAGLQVEPELFKPRSYDRLLITVNSRLGMSPGKAAVAAAHALQLYRDQLVAAWGDNKPFERFIETLHVQFGELDNLPTTAILVRDAGHTEVEAGSHTAAISLGN